MKINDEYENPRKDDKRNRGFTHKGKTHSFPNRFHCSSKDIAIYTVLSILRCMKEQLGLEAMLEYLHFYLNTIDRYNPKLKRAVQKGISLMDVERIYKDARS